MFNMKNNNAFNIVIAGGSGNWADENYYSGVLKLKSKYTIRIVAIIDPYDPHKETTHPNLQKILEIDNPEWINIDAPLDDALKAYSIDLFIIATNPTCRQVYIDYALDRKISVICDKPIIVRRNAAFDTKSANAIMPDFMDLTSKIKTLQEQDKNYIFCVPLRRRVLTPFVHVIDELKKEYHKTGEGIRHFNFILNSGINKYPMELATEDGAHAYLNGVGTLSHSSYHYIDFMAWCMSSANPNAQRARVTLTNITRISDYLNQRQYQTIWDLNQGEKNITEVDITNESILNAELDFSFAIKLYDQQDNQISHFNYTAKNTGFSNRLLKYPDNYPLNYRDYSHRPDGGRMSDIYFDIQQGAIQSIKLIKNDVALQDKHTIKLVIRKHPHLGLAHEEIVFNDAYAKNTLTPTDILETIVSGNFTQDEPRYKNMIPQLDSQYLTNQLFSTFYELIAMEYANKGEFVYKDIFINNSFGT